MKKSETYYMAQIAVINSPCIAPERKLEILRVLMENEDVAKYCEEQEEKRTIENVVAELKQNKTLVVEQ